MSKFRRIFEIVFGVLSILMAICIMVDPSFGTTMIILLLGVSLTAAGIRGLIYYFTMARYMVGGRSMLYQGLIFLDLGLFALTLSDVSPVYIMLYLIVCRLFSGVVSVLRTMESKKLGASSWKLSLSAGVFDLLISVLCAVFIRDQSMMVIIYAVGMIYNAVVRIITACRRTAIVYVQ